MESIEKRILTWLVICLFVVIDFLLIPIGFAHMFPFAFQKMINKIGDVDVLAFIGAIIGGLLTLFGVKMTIDKQNDEKFIDAFPQKIKLLNKIVEDMKIVMVSCYKLDSVKISDMAIDHVDPHLLKATNIDGYVYSKIEELQDVMLEYHNIFSEDRTLNRIHHYKYYDQEYIDEWSGVFGEGWEKDLVPIREKSNKMADQMQDRIASIIAELEDYKENLIRRFKKMNKRIT